MNLYAITSLLCAAFCLMLAAFAMLAGKAKSYRLLMCFNLAVTFWGVGNFVIAVAGSPDVAHWGWKIAYFGGFFIGTIFYHLVAVVCKLHRRSFLVFAYTQSTFFTSLNLATDLVMNDMRNAFGFYYVRATLLLIVATFLYLFFVIVSYIDLVKYSRTASKRNKVLVNYMIFGFLFGFLGGTSILLPQFGVDIVYPIGNVGVFIYAGILTYAILKYDILRLEDLAAAARRDKLAAIGTLAASINHEIRNPLYVIQGLAESYLSSVKEGIFKDETQAVQKSNEILAKTAEQAKRAMEIMKHFAVFAKAGLSNKAVFEKIDLHETLNSVLPLIRHELELDKIELIQRIPQELSSLQADKRHIEEILFNLIVNACQAMKETGGKIELDAAQSNGSVQIKVRDNGPGIPENKLQKIFEPFYTTKDEGTGLGLYITKQLVERNGGKISVKSKPGEGTTFLLEFKR